MISLADIHRAKILIVDDQAVNVQLLDYLLSNTGYSAVSGTTDPRQVAGMHREHCYDLIILDLHMPGMSGFDVMRALQPLEAGAYLPVLVVTADPDKKLAALEAGARDFVSKPFDPLEVLTRIRNLLEVRLMHNAAKDHNALLEQTVRQRTATLQRFRGAMDATADAIFLIDAGSATLADVNDGACRMLGHTREELLALDPGRLLPGARARLAAPGCDAGPGAPALTECALARRDGAQVPVEMVWQWQDGEQRGLLIAVARDIGERRLAQERLRHMAHYDRLTGLPNRTLFRRSLERAIGAAAQAGAGRVALLFIALDRFKGINDTLGAALGDELLRQFSGRLVQRMRLRDTAGRMGDDEFALILATGAGQEEILALAAEVREALRAPFELAGHAATLTASIGIALYPDDAAEAETLTGYAATAMARAKQAGRDNCRFFTAAMNAQVVERVELELALQGAAERGELTLHYQPKVDLHSGRVSGVEALLRWRRPGAGLVSPAEFVPVLEDTGLIVAVGAWVIDTACRQIAQWRAGGAGPVHVAVNVSSRQFAEGDVEGDVRAALARHRIAPGLLELELTESALMSNAEHTALVLGELKKIGVRIAIDDFGTGYSSLAYLQRFPIDKLKIDIAFVRHITSNPGDAAIAQAIISMAHSLKLGVIAEGVETLAQLEHLRRLRCDEIQGFYFSRPLPGEELGLLLASGHALPAEASHAAASLQSLLIVDDAGVQRALQRLLARDGYRILSAPSPQAALALLALHPVQVILCDQRMALMSGTDFLGRVKQMYPDTIRIILSDDAGLEAVLDSINRGAIYRFYTKPWDDAELRENLRLAFHHHWLMNRPRPPGGFGSGPGQIRLS